MPRLILRVLGPPLVELDAQPVQLGRRKAVALLVYLTVTCQPHSRDALATLLWPELDQSHARGQLRRTLSLLNRTLGKEWLALDRETVEWAGHAEAWIDVEHLRACLAGRAMHGHPPEETCTDCIPLLEEAETLYRDGFLAGFTLPDAPAFDEWQFFEGEGLREQVSSALQQLTGWYRDRREYDAAIPYARRWLALDPLHEPAHRELMALYARSGQRAASLRQYAECERILDQELGDIPSQQTAELYRAIQAERDLPSEPLETSDESAGPASPRLDNLPVQLTPFVGREQALAELSDLLTPPSQVRLITVLGPGGIGKTRLAIEAARRRAPSFCDGAFFVALAPVQSSEAIIPAIAQAVGLSFARDKPPRDQLHAYLRGRQALLLLDNVEQLVDGARQIADLLSAARDVTVLATSRVRLDLRVEQPFLVAPMDYPKRPDVALAEAGTYGAIALFADGARRARSAFELNEANFAQVVRICRLVEGMPLALLLAASWADTLSAAEIADEIERGLDLLSAEWQDAPVRHRSMRAAIDASWRMLGDRERQVLAWLSVFHGGFAREAATDVAGANARTLQALIHKSFLQRDESGRYQMHELVRQYAAEQLLAQPGEMDAARDAHCAYYCSALEAWGAQLRGPQYRSTLQVMDLELDNIRTAWAWATANAHISQIERAAEPLAHYYDARWRDPECSAAMHAAAETLEVTASAEGLHALITVLAWEARYCDDLDRAQRTLERCLVLLERPELAHTDTRRVRALVLDSMAYSHLLRQAAPTRALACVDESLTLYRALADRWGLLRALTTACMVRRFAFDLAEAERLGQEAVSVARALGHLEQVAWNLTLVSNVVHFQGDYERGEHLGREAVALYRQLGDRLGVALGLSQLSTLLINQGKFADTRAVGLESIQILRELGREDLVSMPALWLGYAEMCLGNYAEAKAQLEIKLAGRDADGLGGPFALMGLAQLAIASGHAERAIQLQRQCVAMMRQVNEHLALAGSLAVLAAILVTAGLPEEARPHLVESLCLIDAHPYPTPPSQLLAASALFLAQEGDVERATEVWALAASHRLVSDSRWFQDVFGTPITAAAQALPPPARVAAEERGRVRDIRQTVKELLADLRPDSN